MVRSTEAVASGRNTPAVAWKVTFVPSGSVGESCTTNVETVAPSAGAEAGAVTKRTTPSGSAATKETSSVRVSPATFSMPAVTTADSTCWLLCSSMVAVPVPSAATGTCPEAFAVPTSVPALVENSTVRLSGSALGSIRATRRRRETPSAGRVVCWFAEVSVSAPATGGAVGE